jgi:Glycosyl transferase family 2
MLNSPLVSVVMVACNVDRFLTEAIESILGQTFRDFEFIIVDYGSTDKSKAIISGHAAHDSRIRFHCIPPCGLAEARNAGCFLAQGRYIAVMDADDLALPERLALQVAFMEEHPQVGLLGGAVKWVDTLGRSLRVDSVPTEDDDIRTELQVRCPFWQPSVLVRTQAFRLAGGYRSAFAPAEDYDLWLRIVDRFQCANLPDVVLHYRIHPYQVSMRKRAEQTRGVLGAQVSAASRKSGLPDPLDQVKEISPDVLAALGVPHSRQRNVFISDYQLWIRHMCMAGEYPTALNAAVEILRTDLRDIARWQVANLHLTVAGLLWRKRHFLSSAVSVARAVVTRPLVVGRPLRVLLGLLLRANARQWGSIARSRVSSSISAKAPR